jgi:chromosome segregation ATPase
MSLTAYVAGAMGGLPGVDAPNPPVPASVDGERMEEKKELLRVQTALAGARIEIEEARIAREGLEVELEGATDGLSHATEILRGLSADFEKVAGQHSEEVIRVAALQGEAERFEIKRSELEGALAESRTEMSECKNRASRLEGERDELRGLVEGAEKKWADLKGEKEALEERLKVAGDWNGDGRADVRDARAICLLLAGGEPVSFVTHADMNADGKIDMGDVLLIAKTSLGSQ